MEQQELARRLVKIAEGIPGIIIAERACWLDGQECPYGKPEGKFAQRPAVFCHMPKEGEAGREGCAKLSDYQNELLEFAEIYIKGLRESLIDPEELEKISAEGSIRLSEMVKDISELYENKEKEIIKLAGEILASQEENDDKNPEVIASSEFDALL